MRIEQTSFKRKQLIGTNKIGEANRVEFDNSSGDGIGLIADTARDLGLPAGSHLHYESVYTSITNRFTPPLLTGLHLR